jgi:uncharacterized protein (DUF1501 family)
MAITRRQFLKRTSAAAAGTVLGPGLWGNLWVRRALADTIGDRYFIVLFLDGGNDGLNTVIPATNGAGTLRTAYDAARKTGNGGIQIAASALGSTLVGNDPNTGAQLALHPGFGGLKHLYDLGKLAIIQGCGYPDYSLSHEQSRGIWETANPLGVSALTGTGWAGRHLAVNYSSTQIPGVAIADSVAPELRQYATSVLAINRLADFGFPYDYEYDYDDEVDDVPARRAAFAALCASATGGTHPTQIYIGDSGTATLVSSESYPEAHQAYQSARASWAEMYNALDTGTARKLREVAKIIYGVEQGLSNVNARFFQLSNGGYDTHSDQGGAEIDGQHYTLHQEVGDALKVFYDDCANMGVANKVCVLVWSEFSRRIPQNGNGTDHGSQGPMFVIGGAVNGGIYGNHPNINEAALDDEGNTVYRQDANPYRSTDFRDVYGTVLKHWLNMTHAGILGGVLQLDPGPAADYWTVANFDLGFLP